MVASQGKHISIGWSRCWLTGQRKPSYWWH